MQREDAVVEEHVAECAELEEARAHAVVEQRAHVLGRSCADLELGVERSVAGRNRLVPERALSDGVERRATWADPQACIERLFGPDGELETEHAGALADGARSHEAPTRAPFERERGRTNSHAVRTRERHPSIVVGTERRGGRHACHLRVDDACHETHLPQEVLEQRDALRVTSESDPELDRDVGVGEPNIEAAQIADRSPGLWTEESPDALGLVTADHEPGIESGIAHLDVVRAEELGDRREDAFRTDAEPEIERARERARDPDVRPSPAEPVERHLPPVDDPGEVDLEGHHARVGGRELEAHALRNLTVLLVHPTQSTDLAQARRLTAASRVGLLAQAGTCVDRKEIPGDSRGTRGALVRGIMKNAASVLALALAVAALGPVVTGCSESVVSEPKADVQIVKSELPRDRAPNVTPVELDAFSSDQAAAAIDLYQAARVGRAANIFLSPQSLSTALAMTYAGARGATKNEMKKALHFNLDDDRLHKAFDFVDLALAGRTKTTRPEDAPPRLEVANAVWGQRGLAFSPAYLDTLAQSYGAGLHSVDFKTQTEPSRAPINAWVEEKTEQRIRDLLPAQSLNADTRLVLVNAVYFKAKWEHLFEARPSPVDFTKLDGSKVPATMIADHTDRAYSETDEYEALEIAYTGRETSMLVIAPKVGQFDSFEASLTGGKVLDILDGLKPRDVIISMPKLKLEMSIDLRQPLERMGMVSAFDRADFTGITTAEPLKIEKVLQKTFLAVDENGTEAAAATAVVGSGGSAGEAPKPVRMIVDRPYMLAIVDKATKSILFFGRILEPKL